MRKKPRGAFVCAHAQPMQRSLPGFSSDERTQPRWRRQGVNCYLRPCPDQSIYSGATKSPTNCFRRLWKCFVNGTQTSRCQALAVFELLFRQTGIASEMHKKNNKAAPRNARGSTRPSWFHAATLAKDAQISEFSVITLHFWAIFLFLQGWYSCWRLNLQKTFNLAGPTILLEHSLRIPFSWLPEFCAFKIARNAIFMKLLMWLNIWLSEAVPMTTFMSNAWKFGWHTNKVIWPKIQQNRRLIKRPAT